MSQLTLAISERTLRAVVTAVEKDYEFSSSGHTNGDVSVGFDAAAHAEGGVITLIGPRPRPFYNGGIVDVSGVEIIWDKLDGYLQVYIPQVCLGGFCIVPSPFGCIISAPRVCFFGTTIRVGLNLGGGLIVSRVSLGFAPKVMDVQTSDGRQWHVIAHTVYSQINLIDWGATLDNIVHAAVKAIVNDLLGFLPDWAKDLITSVLGDLADWICGLIGLGPKIVDWLQQQLGVSLGLFDLALVAIAQHFEDKLVLLSLDNPYKLMDGVDPTSTLPALPPVEVPIASLAADIADHELIAKIGV
jgi:hypothetical protein